jgi:hypothetical protein
MVAALFLAAFVACGSDSSTNPGANVAGNYSLRTVNGSQLPYTLSSSGVNKLEITDDVVIINDGGTYTESGHTRTTTSTGVTTQSVVDAGTYTLNGTAITFRSSVDGSSTFGTVSGSTLTIADVNAGISAVYSK